MAVTSELNHTCSYESNEMNGLESMSLIITIISLGNAFPTSPIEEANAPEVRARLCTCALVQTRPRGRASSCAPVHALHTLRCAACGCVRPLNGRNCRRAARDWSGLACVHVRVSAAHAPRATPGALRLRLFAVSKLFEEATGIVIATWCKAVRCMCCGEIKARC